MNVNGDWWGLKVRMDHEETQSVIKSLGGGQEGVAAILRSRNVNNAWIQLIASAISLTSMWISACDDGNGVNILVGWLGAVWVENPPAGA